MDSAVQSHLGNAKSAENVFSEVGRVAPRAPVPSPLGERARVRWIPNFLLSTLNSSASARSSGATAPKSDEGGQLSTHFIRFIKFCLVGGSGVLVDMGVLFLLADSRMLGLNITFSKICAAEIALINNFIWNDVWTFRRASALDPRLSTSNRDGVHRRFLVFNIICGVGIVLAVVLLQLFHTWLNWNLYWANLAVIVLVTLWNFGMNIRWNWRSKWPSLLIILGALFLPVSESLGLQGDLTPLAKSQDGFKFRLGDVVVRPNSIVKTLPPRETSAISIPFRVIENTTNLTNWAVIQMGLSDSLGHRASTSPVKHITNGWLIYNGWGDLDHTTLWKLKVMFARDGDFAPTNLVSMKIRYPLEGTITTNFFDLPLAVYFRNANMLTVEARPAPADTAVTLVAITDEEGRNIAEGTGTQRPTFFSRAVSVRRGGGYLILTFAVQRSISLQFEFRPVLQTE